MNIGYYTSPAGEEVQAAWVPGFASSGATREVLDWCKGWPDGKRFMLRTRDGVREASPDGWIIQHDDGTYSTVSGQEFDAYESVDYFVEVVERCGWEAETWHFLVRVSGNENALSAIGALMKQAPDTPSTFRWGEGYLLRRSEAEALCAKPSHTDYLREYTLVDWKIAKPTCQEDLYKGGVRERA